MRGAAGVDGGKDVFETGAGEDVGDGARGERRGFAIGAGFALECDEHSAL